MTSAPDGEGQADPAGALIVVGTGIQAVTQMTAEAEANIAQADIVLYLVADPVTEFRIRQANPNAESMRGLYETDKPRITSYEEMVELMLGPVREGRRVCAVFYGHPGVFVNPSHDAIRRARAEGHPARMLPAISAEDCLFADLGVDPAIPGCQSFEATDFLLFSRQHDPKSSLVLWQIGVIGDVTFQADGYESARGLRVLAEHLTPTYGETHMVVVYEAAHLPTLEPRCQMIRLGDLPEAPVTAISTLYVPPREVAEIDRDMLGKLGMTEDSLTRVELRPLALLDLSAVG